MPERSDKDLRPPLSPTPISSAQTAAWDGRVTFEDVAEMARRFYARVAGRVSLPIAELARELSELCDQLDFLIKSAFVLHQQCQALAATSTRPSLDWPLEQYTRFVLGTYTTAFYYLAHRAQAISSSNNHRLPGFERYRQAVGVRSIRNDEIEHPKPGTFVSIGGGASHSVFGPRARSKRSGGALTSDPAGWLFSDAVELEANIKAALQLGLNAPLPQADGEKP